MMFAKRITSVMSNQHERKDKWFSDIDTPVVDESSTFHKRVVLGSVSRKY